MEYGFLSPGIGILAYCLLTFSLFTVPVEVSGSCNTPVTLNSWEGTIQNANFGVSHYQNDQDCSWTVQVSQGSLIVINADTVVLEEPGDGGCFDYIQIFADSVSLTERVCGTNQLPPNITSPANTLRVLFHSDNSNGFPGFSLTYTGTCTNVELDATTGGTIESPSAGSHINCHWKLIADEGYKIIIQYDEYSIYHDDCANHYLKVYNGRDKAAGLLSSYCGNGRTPDTSTSNYLFIAYSGGESSSFSLSYSVQRIMPCEKTPCLNGGTCTDIGYNDTHCECISGYTGKFCEEDVNECDSNPCEHNAECIDKINQFECKCQGGYTGVQCAEDINECLSTPCMNGGECTDNINRFTCNCIDGYRGSTCNIEPEAPTCEAEVDDVDGSHISWNSADPDEEDTQNCPEGTDGTATRRCEIVDENPMKVNWGNPDLSECTSPEFAEVAQLAENLEDSPTESEIVEVLSVLQNITNTEDEMLPGDLTIAVDSVAKSVSALSQTDVKDLGSVVQYFSETVDNIVDQSSTSAWKNGNDADEAAETATSLLNSTEIIAGVLAEKIFSDKSNSTSTQISVTVKNFDFNVGVFDNSDDSVSKIMYGGEYKGDGTADSSIQLPVSILNVDSDTEPEFVAVYTARFSTLDGLLNASADSTQNQTINGDIVSAKVIGYDKKNLQEPIKYIIKHKSGATQNPTCVFLNLISNEWSTDGCSKVKSNATHTECECDHLTNFAVLMDVHGIHETLADEHNVALSVLSYIGGTLSIIGCILSVFIFEFFKLKSDRIRVHENLAGAMAASLFVFLVGIDRTENRYVCKTFAILLHFLLTAMFMWMLVEGIHLYLALVKVFGTSSHIKKYLILGWGVPAVVIGISVGVFFDKYGSESVCWLSTEMLLIVFVPTVAIVVILNTAVLIIVVRVMLHSLSAKDKIKGNSQDQEETSAIKTSLKAALVLLPLLGLTWVFGFLSVNEYTIIFTYMFAICNSLQGVIFFLFHCLMNVEVKKAYERRYRKSMAATSSMSTTTTSRVAHQPSKRRPSAGTDLTKRRTSISSQESYAYDNPTADTSFDGKVVKRNNEENELKKKALKSTPVKLNDIKMGLTTGTETEKEKGLVEEAKVAMETILEKRNNANTISGNMA